MTTRDAELPDETGAVPARRQRRHHRRAAIAALPAGVAKGVGLAVHRRVVVLDPPVVAPPEQRAVGREQRGADRDPAFGGTERASSSATSRSSWSLGICMATPCQNRGVAVAVSG
ncbi:MAG: hypothetical protein R2705_22510 [Ilumatobacteraceae bacterium]